MNKQAKSIRRRVGTVFLLLGLGPLVLMGAIITAWIWHVELEQAVELQDEIAQRVQARLDALSHEVEARLLLVPKVARLDRMDHEELRETLSKVMSHRYIHSQPIFDEIALLDAAGFETARVSRKAVVLPSEYVSRMGSGEFQVPSILGEVYYGPVRFEERTGEPLMSIGVPVVSSATGVVDRVLVARLSLRQTWEDVASIKVGEGGVVYLTDGDGRVIAHPNHSVVLKGTHVMIGELTKGLVRDLNGRRVLRAYRKISLPPQTVVAVIERPLAEVVRPALTAMATTALFVLISLGGAVAFGLHIVRKVVKPIERLAAMAETISRGGLTEKADVGDDDEIGMLSRAFNKMADTLVRTIDSLKMRMQEHALAENTINEQNEFLQNILESLTLPFYVIDTATYTVKLANSAAAFGSSGVGRKCHELTHHSSAPCSGERHPCTIREIMRTKAPVILEHVHFDAKGDARIYEVHGYPVLDQLGSVAEVIEYTMDITERRRSEEELRKVRHLESIGRLAAGVAHEINNPLANASLNIQMLREKLEGHGLDDALLKKMRSLEGNIDRASSIARGLLQFSRMRTEEPASSGALVPFDVSEKIADSLELTGFYLKGVTVRTNLAEGAEAMGDAVKFEQVMVNLITNAVESMHGAGLLSISNRCEGSRVVVVITDTGSGIADEHLTKVFDPFFTTKDVGKGTGLGLSICYGLLNDMNGSIEITNQQDGACVTVTLPRPGADAEG
jgi:signal transduction histidine kinase